MSVSESWVQGPMDTLLRSRLVTADLNAMD